MAIKELVASLKKRQMRNISVLLFLLTITFNVIGQDRLEKLDYYLAELEKNDSFSGVILIGENGKVIYSKELGYTDIENKIKNNLNSQFNLSSTSKLFTGTCILKLVQEGAISIDEKIGKYFPELEYRDKVTIRHLLTHSSGLTDFYLAEGFTYKNVKTCMDIIPYIKNQKLKFNPGDSVHYATGAMILLGALIEKISGISYQEYVTKNILEPLKMTNTSFINYAKASESEDYNGTYAKGYIKNNKGKIERQTFTEKDKEFIPLSAGGVWSSASDLLKFDEGVYNYKILRKEFVDLMTSKYVDTGWPNCFFGYVWLTVNSGKNAEAVGHGGNSKGHHNIYFHYKKDSKVIIALANYGFVDIFEIEDKIENIMYN